MGCQRCVWPCVVCLRFMKYILWVESAISLKSQTSECPRRLRLLLRGSVSMLKACKTVGLAKIFSCVAGSWLRVVCSAPTDSSCAALACSTAMRCGLQIRSLISEEVHVCFVAFISGMAHPVSCTCLLCNLHVQQICMCCFARGKVTDRQRGNAKIR